MLHCCLHLARLTLPSSKSKEGHLHPIVQREGGGGHGIGGANLALLSFKQMCRLRQTIAAQMFTNVHKGKHRSTFTIFFRPRSLRTYLGVSHPKRDIQGSVFVSLYFLSHCATYMFTKVQKDQPLQSLRMYSEMLQIITHTHNNHCWKV